MTHEAIHTYAGLDGCDSVCRIRVYEPQPDVRVVVFTELPENRGTSITNGMEHLASTVRRALPLPLETTTFVDHYPAEPGYRPGVSHELDDERFSIVTFGTLDLDFDSGWYVYGKPDWKYLSPADVERLIDEEWAS